MSPKVKDHGASQIAQGCSTSIDPIIMSVTIFWNFDCNYDDLEPAKFKVIQSQRSRWESETPLVVSYLTSIVSSIASVFIFEIFMIKSCDLNLERFKVI